MKGSIMAVAVVLLMLGSTIMVLAQPDDEGPNQPGTQKAYSHVRVLDITGYPDDQDGDELFDGLQIVAKVNFTRAGDYTVLFKLTPTDGSWWLSSAESQSIKDAPVNVFFEISFEGWKIRNRNYNGYLVAEVAVLDPADNAVLSSYKETLDRYYRAVEWESTYSGARVIGFGDTNPLDFNGNGKYEILELPVLIEATTPGLYRVVVYYSWESNTALTAGDARTRRYSITNWTQLEEGANSVPIWVSGAHVMDASSISLTVYVYKGAFPGKSFSQEIGMVSDEIYEAPTLRDLYRDRHNEVAVDRDGDGLAEVLRVAVGLDVDIPGQYTFTALLAPAGTIDYDRTVSAAENFEPFLAERKAAKATMTWTYEPGDRWAWFSFDGRLLNTWGYDGAYDVYVFALGPKPSIPTSFKFETSEFSADQFIPPAIPLEFTGRNTDEGIMDPVTALFKGLRVTFNAKVNIPGHYTAFAVLYHEGQDIAYTRVEGRLDEGDRTIEVVFPGQAIYNSHVQGTFTAVIWVQGAGFAWNATTLEHPMTARYVTSAYSYEMFTPPRFQVDRKDPQPIEDLDFILLRTGIMVVRIDRDKPDLTFYMTDDDGRTALFRVVYTRLLAFTDVNDDGAPQAAEVAYTSVLLSYDWELSEIELKEDPTNGRVATFELTTTIDLVEDDPLAAELARPLFTVEDFARITLTFTLASRDVERTDEVGTYSILGGAELKVDINIDVLTPVEGIDFLTIEQVLRDDRGAYLPKTTEEDADAGTPDEVRRYRETQELKQRIEFRKRASTPAFYSWVKRAEITKVDGTQEVTDVLAAYVVTDSRMILYLIYPYDVETATIFHDPSLGIFEGGIPGIPEEWRAVFDPMLYGVAALAAVAMITALRSRGRKDEDEDEVDEMEVDGEPLEASQGGQPPEGTGTQAPPRPSPGTGEIPELPEEPVETSGSTLLLNPPPKAPEAPREHEAGWVEWEE